MDYLSALNEKQLEAVTATEGYLRVIAGAGSGKTKLLVSRYAYLVKEYGINSANILCVTFTNKAAGEMKRRIRNLIGQEYDTSLICTYHGFCVRVLREDIEKIFYPKEFQIIDNAQQKAILGDIYQKFELKLDHASFEKIIKQIAFFKARYRDYVAKMCCTDHCQIMPEIATVDDQIIEEFLQKQKQIYAMDFHDLLYFVLDIFNRCPEVLEKWQDRLNYIQVDEFQDSSNTEMELVDRLSEKHKNLMIVGDPDQNIYEWRGSDVKLLVDFDKTHIPTQTVILNQNYRSTPQILRCANTLIEKNVFRLKKDLFTKSGDGVQVYHYHEKNEFAEADQIIANIHQIRKETGCNYADFAVLYRSGFLSRVIEKKFTENGVPYEIFGGVKFYQRMEIQDVMAYLRLVAFDDDISFKRIINKPRRKFGRVKLQRLLALQKDGESLFQTLQDNLSDPAFKGSGVQGFLDTINQVRQLHHTIPLSECVERICTDSAYEKYIRELGDMERFENLSEFKRIASEYENNFGEKVSLKEFINQISLQSEDDGEEACDMVKLMTIHAAKGLEFPYVFVIGFSEGVFPSAKTIEERKKMGLEEERRLCYVAITRAEKRLFLLDSEGFTQNGKQKLPSRFLKEIGEENYIRVGTISKELQYNADRYAAQLYDEPVITAPKTAGTRVTHPAFGEGEILGFGRNNNSYRVKFDKLASEREISVDFFNKPRTLPQIPTPAPEEPAQLPQPTEQKLEAPTEEPAQVQEEKAEILTEEPVQSAQEPVIEEQPQQVEEPADDPLDGYEEVDTFNLQRSESGQTATESKPPVNKPQQPNLEDYDNLWKRDDVPKTGWVCTGITDLGEPVGVCEMCGHQIIRYVHHMVHPNFRSLGVGCICAGKMEGNIEQAKKREQDFKSKEARRENFKNRHWKTSKNSNSYLKIKDHLVVLYYNKNYNNWKYSLDNQFCPEVYPTREEAIDAAFEALEKLR
ncbi:MAG: UvrD-helicase domain-containing protein [Oscillospiraceae bacterium]|nr:UvrD-helicase domain-containing protein [Oscillospiraceae bacterium]